MKFIRCLLILFVSLLTLTACLPFGNNNNQNSGAFKDLVVPAGTLLQVVKPNGQRVYFKIDDLKRLKAVERRIDSKEYHGPLVFTILQASGIEGFALLTFVGKRGSVTMKSAKVSDGVLIATDQHDQLKLLANSLPADQRIDNLNMIIVE